MDAATVYLNALDNAWAMTLRITDGLKEKELCKQPGRRANTIAWTVWHVARLEDLMVTKTLMGRPEVWTAGGWAKKFGMARARKLAGAEDTPKQAFGFRPPSRDALLAYAALVRDNTRAYLKSVRSQDLDEKVKVEEWGGELVARAALLDSVLKEAQQHVGQIAYARGLLRGPEDL